VFVHCVFVQAVMAMYDFVETFGIVLYVVYFVHSSGFQPLLIHRLVKQQRVFSITFTSMSEFVHLCVM
jgi:hypothetical protein